MDDNRENSREQYWLSISEIRELMEAMRKNDMGKLRLVNGGQELRLENREPISVPVMAAPAATVMQPIPATAPVEVTPEPDGNVVTSPIVGTFYAAPGPDQPAFVQVGSEVKQGDVLFIIESMKLMNEVVSEQSGVVREILVENAQAVEYGQPILRIESH